MRIDSIGDLKPAIILGTRPEIVKMSPIIRELRLRKIDHVVIHTGQHYDFEMDGAFFRDLELPSPDYNLKVGSGTHAVQTAKLMVGLEEILGKEEPSVALVQGDTNTVLAGALVAAKIHVPLGHVEAGLRSFDRMMPEEVNRVVADHLSDLLFAPTEESRGNLLAEGIANEKIIVTGNTVVDAIEQNLVLSVSHKFIVDKLGLEEQGYFLVTIHRAENVDDKARLKAILKALKDLSRRYSVDVVFPVHPRTRKMIKSFGLSTRGLTTVNPVGYLDFLQLESKARLVFTDSGGVQEEACVLRTPCVTLRENTERPETVRVGANVVAGAEESRIVEATVKMLGVTRIWDNPFGAGDAGKRIVDVVVRES